jgi:hypothetical protein
MSIYPEPAAGPSQDRYVDLPALRKMADNLNDHVRRLSRRSGELDAVEPLLNDRSMPGYFNEAVDLADANRDAIRAMKAFVHQLRDLCAFADSMTIEVAKRVQDAGDQAAADMARAFAEASDPTRVLTGRSS